MKKCAILFLFLIREGHGNKLKCEVIECPERQDKKAVQKYIMSF